MNFFPIIDQFGHLASYIIYLFIGIGFGATLEMAGFANSPKLAAQFYLKDMTVLKVMFTAIITAMVLVYLATSFLVLDIDQVWINPTYLWPGIVGGLIMGFGFIIGGFCPGTSLVALATLKLDGIFFALGAFFGIFLFGETVGFFEGFWNSSFMGRFTLYEWFGVDAGVVVFAVSIMALFMFWGGEKLEHIFGDIKKSGKKFNYLGAITLLVLAGLVMVVGQPSLQQKWSKIAIQKQNLLINRDVYIHPGELLTLMNNDDINLIMYDVRPEKDYNMFHLLDAKMIPDLTTPGLSRQLKNLPVNSLIVVMGNDEQTATEVWKRMAAMRVPNTYILDGGINNWLNIFGHEGHEDCPATESGNNENFVHVFPSALGDRNKSSAPMLEHFKEIHFQPKVKIQKQSKKQGGCS